MTRFIAFLVFIMPLIAYGQDVDIPDEKFLQALIEDGVDTDGDGIIQIAEAEEVTELIVQREEIGNLEGIQAFVNLTKLECGYNNLTEIDLSSNLKLKELGCQGNTLAEIDLSNNPALTELHSNDNKLTEIDLSNNPALTHLRCRNNKLTELNLTENPALTQLTCYQNELKILDLSNNSALMELNCYKNELIVLDLSNNPDLRELNCYQNELTEINISNNSKLTILNCNENNLQTIDVSNSPFLVEFSCSKNNIKELDLSNNPVLIKLSCSGSYLRKGDLENLNLSNNPLISKLFCSNNKIEELDLSSSVELLELYCSYNELSKIDLLKSSKLVVLQCDHNIINSLNISTTTEIEELNCSYNRIESIDLSHNTKLIELYSSHNRLQNINVSHNTELVNLDCSHNDLESIDLSHNTELVELNCSSNLIEELDIKDNVVLKELRCLNTNLSQLDLSSSKELEELYADNNEFESIDFSNSTKLVIISLQYTPIKNIDVTMLSELENLNIAKDFPWPYDIEQSIDLSNNHKLERLIASNNNYKELDLKTNPELNTLWCTANQLSALDLSNNPKLEVLVCSSNPLEFINISNGTALNDLSCTIYNPYTICVDEIEFIYVESIVNANATITTNCFFSPEDTLYEISGNVRFSEQNQCTDEDVKLNDIHFKVDNGSTFIYKPRMNQGLYSINLPANQFAISLDLDQPDLFLVDPDPLIIVVDSTSSAGLFDFCVSPTDTKAVDLKIKIIPIDQARPGFEVDYKILYENQGNITSSGIFELNYPDEVGSYLSSSDPLTDDGDKFTLSYVDLLPFEKRELLLTMKLNSPMDEPPLTDGMITYTAEIIPDEAEYDMTDNHFLLNQEVVNSYDPNDKTCLQGNTLLDEMIGSYVDYLIRFENEGTASAVNIRIEDEIDTTTFDLSSIRVTDASHPVEMSIEDRNKVQFIFTEIELPFDGDLNNGYVAFKIKTWPQLSVGDSLQNSADIYFDFNLPIHTDTTLTTVVTDMDRDGYHNLLDCDDNNAEVNPDQEEVVYNGLDDDCDPSTLDDDLDQDSFSLERDCDDGNAEINPDQSELVYNGIDDDCNPTTLDDDIDQDGFLLADDCNDDEPNINPDAEDIPNNGIDEDCDGMDATSSLHELSDAIINIYPNPAVDRIYIEVEGLLDYQTSFYDLTGQLIQTLTNSAQIFLDLIPSGTYLLEVQDLNSGQRIVERVVVGR